ncbi:MAG: hypothetical protein ACFCAD_24760 [Pleurocapsa sp.]
MGKLEPLKHDLSSARIEDSAVLVRRRSARPRCVEKNRWRNRLVYKVSKGKIRIFACRYHY